MFALRQGRYCSFRAIPRVSRGCSSKGAPAKPPTVCNTVKKVADLDSNALILRFSNENSYLNWARNGVLSCGVGVSMYDQEHHRGAQLSGAGLLMLGFGFITAGTVKYIYYILRFQSIMKLSLSNIVSSITFATGSLGIWLTATACFLETVPIHLDHALLTEPIADYLPTRIRQGLIDTYSLYIDDQEQLEEEERIIKEITNRRNKSN